MNITVEYLQMGQPDNYRPHIYEANITAVGQRLMDWQVHHLVRALVHNFYDEDPSKAGTMSDYFRPKLKTMELKSSDELDGVKREVWYVRVEEPYTD